MERRKFISIATLGIVSLSLPAGYFLFRVPEYDPAIAKPALLSSLWDTETIVEIGKRYMAQYPHESSERNLVAFLSEKKSLEKSIREDYETGRIVILEGWVLSITEARQCALYSFLETS